MLTPYLPISMMVALWPTGDFLLPIHDTEQLTRLGQALCGQLPVLGQQQVMTANGEAQLPPEMPRLILTGGQRWQLDLAPARVSLHLRNFHGGEPTAPNGPALPATTWFAELREQLLPLTNWLAENNSLRVFRLGCVVQFFCNTRSSANEKIANYFLHPRALQQQVAHEIQLSVLSKLALPGGQLVNRWLRVQPLRSVDPSHVDFAAQIEIDINSLAEDTRLRGAREVAQFLEAVERHVEQDVPLLNDSDFFV